MAGKRNTDIIPSPDDIRAGTREKQAKIVIKDNTNISKLSEKKQALVLSMVADPEKPFVQHCREVGYKVGPNTCVSKLKKQIAGALGPSLRDAGIFEIDIAHAIARGMNADKLQPVKVNIRDKKTHEITGEEIKMVCAPDYRTRAVYTKIAIQLGGYYAAIQHEIKGKVDHVHSPGKKVMEILDGLSPDDLDRNIRERAERVEAEFEIEDEKECA